MNLKAGLVLYGLLATFMVTVAGCSQEAPPDPTTAIAIGSVSIDGKPIPGVMFTLASIENPRRRATGMVRMDGTFRLAGSPIGKCKVVFDNSSMKFRDPGSYVTIPARYNSLLNTDIVIELKPGENKGLVLELTKNQIP